MNSTGKRLYDHLISGKCIPLAIYLILETIKRGKGEKEYEKAFKAYLAGIKTTVKGVKSHC